MTVEGILSELERAWNTGDSTGLAANFREDAEFVDVLGRLLRGRGVIADEHRKIFSTIYRGSQVEFQQVASRPIGDDIILAHTTSTLRVPAGPRAGDTYSTQTMIVRDGQILAFHNTIQAEFAKFAERPPD